MYLYSGFHIAALPQDYKERAEKSVLCVQSNPIHLENRAFLKVLKTWIQVRLGKKKRILKTYDFMKGHDSCGSLGIVDYISFFLCDVHRSQSTPSWWGPQNITGSHPLWKRKPRWDFLAPCSAVSGELSVMGTLSIALTEKNFSFIKMKNFPCASGVYYPQNNYFIYAATFLLI